MTVLTEYAVRIKGTQCYLPRSQRRDGRGGSHLEPIDFSKPKGERGVKSRYEQDMQIRSYATKAAAKNLLTSWLRGKYRCADWETGEVDHIKGSSREHMRDQMEIVEIIIVLP